MYLHEKRQDENRAKWMSFLLSAQTGTVVTPEQLLGTEDEVNAGKLSQAERDLAALEEKIRAAGVSHG